MSLKKLLKITKKTKVDKISILLNEITNNKNYNYSYYNLTENLNELFGEQYEIVHDERSSDGDHDSTDLVIWFKKPNLYFMINGSYSSNDGTDYSYGEFYQVTPYERVVKDWARI